MFPGFVEAALGLVQVTLGLGPGALGLIFDFLPSLSPPYSPLIENANFM